MASYPGREIKISLVKERKVESVERLISHYVQDIVQRKTSKARAAAFRSQTLLHMKGMPVWIWQTWWRVKEEIMESLKSLL